MADQPVSPFKAIGVSGLVHYGYGATGDGRIYEEWLRELVGVRGRRVYREMMDNDPVIGAMLFSFEMLCRQVDWTVEPGIDDAEGNAAATFIDECLHDMDQTWPDTVAEILSMLGFGWSLHELVYKRRTSATSKHPDGRVGWKIWGIRGQETLDHWEFDDDNAANAMVQLGPPDYVFHTIPFGKALLFRTTSKKQNPEGRSLLRNAWLPWYRKKHLEAMEGIGAERDLAGMPVLKIPAEVILAAGQDYTNYQQLMRNVRNDEQASIILPSDRDEKGNPYYEFSLLSAPGTKQFDTDKIITRYDQRITMTVMADFIMIGHDRVGSNAMVRSKSKLFTTGLVSILDSIQEVVNDVAIPQLLRYNGLSTDHAPRLMHGDVERAELDVLGTFLYNLAQAGVTFDMQPGSDLYNFLMKQAGLPETGPLSPGMEPEGPGDVVPDNPRDLVPDAPPAPKGHQERTQITLPAAAARRTARANGHAGSRR